MKIAVIGATGQLALSLREQGELTGHDVVLLGRSMLDLAQARDGWILRVLASLHADAVINAAAYTAVDRAESEPDLAYAVNARGAGAVARATARLRVPLVHISTDYVFSGDKPAPYDENDPPDPIGIYGATKLAGERLVLASGADAAILRTAWVYSPFGNNFVKTMLRLAEASTVLDVVADQRGNPTSALDLAVAALRVASNLRTNDAVGLRGIFHAAGHGDASWAGLAEAVFAASAACGARHALVRPIPAADYITPARRPANSRLDCERLFERHGVRLPDWRDSVAAVVERLVYASIEGSGGL